MKNEQSELSTKLANLHCLHADIRRLAGRQGELLARAADFEREARTADASISQRTDALRQQRQNVLAGVAFGTVDRAVLDLLDADLLAAEAEQRRKSTAAEIAYAGAQACTAEVDAINSELIALNQQMAPLSYAVGLLLAQDKLAEYRSAVEGFVAAHADLAGACAVVDAFAQHGAREPVSGDMLSLAFEIPLPALPGLSKADWMFTMQPQFIEARAKAAALLLGE